jgi:hypothetical protein
VLRANELIGWSSRGYSEDAAQEIRRSSIPLAGSRLLRDALQFSGLSRFGDISLEYELGRLLQPQSSEVWFACPLQALQRPVALLLASTPASEQSSSEVISVLTELTGLCIENIALRIMQESPAAEVARRSAPEAAPEAAPAASETVEDIPMESAPLEAQETAAISSAAEFEPPDATAAAGVYPSAASVQASIPLVQAPPPAAPPLITPKPVELVSEEEKLHTEAKRFARLLVSEIKLYNEQRVLEGRENRDVYVRLKRDIDRSRDMYEKRVSPTVSRKIDYFHDEVIRILGENDPSALGSDYPGPRVES